MVSVAAGVKEHPLREALGKKFSREQQVVLDCPKDIVLVTGGDQSGKSEVAAEWFGEEWLRALKRWGPEERLVGWLVGND